ncbi:vesicle transport through interaction with t-SNAREs homolog 1A isoform X2 [Hydra vulgaris]|uniref:Vesicle transport through interaction with t-SNAREs homolog 1A isoform X2 n=1 Tax=Hydra vulgaris TaxID=6087 RepID=A0ABM4BT54_HYDVU
MSQLFSDYEKHFGIITADIVAKTNKLPNVQGDEKRELVTSVDQKFDDAQELLEQMDLEVRTLSAEHKQKCSIKLKNYKAELKNLEQNMKKAKFAFSNQDLLRSELLRGDDGPHSEDQRSNLLDNSTRLERSNRRLEEGYKICLETEQIGHEIMDNLSRDRETMTRTRDRLRTTNTDLSKSSRILTAMMRRVIQNRILLVFVCLCLVSVIIVVIYFAVRK